MLTLRKSASEYGEGAYGVVFFDSFGKATKVFRKRQGIDRSHVECVFESEREAYAIAGSSERLSQLVPQFFDRVEVRRILCGNGCDISGQFYLDLNYQMERIVGNFHKIGSLNSASAVTVRQRFRAEGILHINDASVTLDGDRILKVIDFAVTEYEVFI